MKTLESTTDVRGGCSVQRMVGRIKRVRGYMEARGFRVGRGTYDLDGMNLRDRAVFWR